MRSRINPGIVAVMAAFDVQLLLWAQFAQGSLDCGTGYWERGLGNLLTLDVLSLGLPLMIVAVPAHFVAWLFPAVRSRRVSYAITALFILGLVATAIVFPYMLPEIPNPRRCDSDG